MRKHVEVEGRGEVGKFLVQNIFIYRQKIKVFRKNKNTNWRNKCRYFSGLEGGRDEFISPLFKFQNLKMNKLLRTELWYYTVLILIGRKGRGILRFQERSDGGMRNRKVLRFQHRQVPMNESILSRLISGRSLMNRIPTYFQYRKSWNESKTHFSFVNVLW